MRKFPNFSCFGRWKLVTELPSRRSQAGSGAGSASDDEWKRAWVLTGCCLTEKGRDERRGEDWGVQKDITFHDWFGWAECWDRTFREALIYGCDHNYFRHSSSKSLPLCLYTFIGVEGKLHTRESCACWPTSSFVLDGSDWKLRLVGLFLPLPYGLHTLAYILYVTWDSKIWGVRLIPVLALFFPQFISIWGDRVFFLQKNRETDNCHSECIYSAKIDV